MLGSIWLNVNLIADRAWAEEWSGDTNRSFLNGAEAHWIFPKSTGHTCRVSPMHAADVSPVKIPIEDEVFHLRPCLIMVSLV